MFHKKAKITLKKVTERLQFRKYFPYIFRVKEMHEDTSFVDSNIFDRLKMTNLNLEKKVKDIESIYWK